MPIALEQFVKQLEDSGVIAPGKLENFVPPKAQPKDAQELARQLVQSKHLTKFQAQEIYAGRAKSLILGNYTILDKIGAGGMGQVFKAEHRRMHRVVAIKMLPKNVMQDAAAAARFQREVEAASKLLHPNIVSAFDADEAGGVHFLAMEFVEGSDLSALVKKNGPLPIATAVNYTLQAAKGLEFAHGEGVVHRDIKPANLLLDKKGTIKILDMGLARISTSDDAATQAELTGTGAVLGTVDYMAPEQALSTKHADARADIYSLGCSLHYLLRGKATYAGDTLMAKLLAHREKPIPTLGADAPEQLQAVFEKMVAKNVDDRYQTMCEVVADLQQCVAASSTIGKSQTISEPPADDGNLSFLAEATAHTQHHQPTRQVKPIRETVKPSKKASGWNRKQLLVVGGGLLGALIALAVIVIKMQTKDGTLVVEINQPDALVQVFDEAGKKIEITQPGGKGSVSISVDPGKHRLQVEKDGFKFFSQDFTVESGGRTEIKATLHQNEIKTNPGVPETDRAIAEILLADHCMLQVLSDGETGWSVDIHNAAQLPGKPFRVIALKTYGDVRLTDKAIRAACALPQLTALSCTGNHAITDDVLRQFRNGLRRITSIDLSNTSVTDMGLQYLDECPAIVTLSLDRTKISDVGLHELERLPAAKAIYLHDTQVTLAGVASLKRALPQCNVEWDDPAKLRTGQPSKPITTFNDPAFQQWMKTVATMAAERQVDAVRKKLVELNPGFDGKVVGWDGNGTPKIENGVVTELRFVTDNVTDISPLRALTELKILRCAGSNAGKGKLFDLSPLRGMKLTELDCGWSQVADLSPLDGMPLTILDCSFTRISDLSPLRGMPLTNLNCGNMPVSNLLPLKGMHLTSFNCGQTEVSDLSPLAGMKLTKLDFNDTHVSDLTPLKGMPLWELWCGPTPISDLSPLKGMMSLTRLGCSDTRVSDLSPLQGLPITALYLLGTPVTDLSPLKRMSLTAISFIPKNISKGIPGIREMKTLRTIGTSRDDKDKFSPDVFWKKYDAGDFGKPDSTPGAPDHKPITTFNDPVFQQWAKAIATMPAEQQVEAVAKKLQEHNPGFDGKETHKIVEGAVREFEISAKNIVDIRPVRALVKLRKFNCSMPWPDRSKFADLSPLAGLPLEEVDIDGTDVASLTPLRGMPLRRLSSECAPVSDLAPLAGMPLATLDLNGTQIADVAPLRGMPLRDLDLRSTAVTDLSPLQQSPLEKLALNSSWLIQDLGPLHGMTTLQDIDLFGTPVFDLSPLAGLKLRAVNVTYSAVNDLSPLKGMPLERLECAMSNVADLSPLADAPLKALNCFFCGVTDLSPLKGMSLNEISFTSRNIRRGIDVLRPMQSLTKIGDDWSTWPPAEFWKKYDAGEIGKPSDKASPALSSPESRQWLKEVAALPAADQVAAVAKRLKKLNDGFDGQVTPTIKGNVVTSLSLSGAGIYDLSPIRALGGLQELNCPFNVTWPKQHWIDLAPLKGLPLRRLIVSGNYAADLLPLKGLPLTDLSLNGSGVSDLAPLAEMKLNSLNVGATAVADLLPLHGMKLSTLICERSRVRNLAPLAAMPLHVLDLSQTGVSDLSPLHGMPLENLSIDRTSVEDLSPLAGMKLKRFCFSPGRIRSGIETIRAMQPLEQIVVREGRAKATFEQTLSPAEFWKKYDAGEFNK